MKNSFLMPVILQLAGVLVIIAEVIIPSGGILSLVAAVLLGYSLYIVFHDLSTGAGIIFVLVDVITIPVLVIVGLKLLAGSPATLRKELARKDGVISQDPDLEKFINMEGSTVTDLRPSGVAVINGKRVDVVSRGDYIEKGSEIVVSSVTGNQIIVNKKEDR